MKGLIAVLLTALLAAACATADTVEAPSGGDTRSPRPAATEFPPIPRGG